MKTRVQGHSPSVIQQIAISRIKQKLNKQIKTRKEANVEDKYISDCLEKAISNMKVEINDEIIQKAIDLTVKNELNKKRVVPLVETNTTIYETMIYYS